MEITISPSLKNLIPGFKLGVITYSNIDVADSPQMVKGRLQLFQENIFFDLQEKEFSDYEGLKEWKAAFKAVGTDPNRYRPSVEALYRRIKKQNYIGTINSAADINNFFSLQYEVPIGIYDVEHLAGDTVEIRIGTVNDEYEGINGRIVSMDKKILSSDMQGAFGSPIVDSARSAVTTSTQNAIQLVYLRPSMDIEESLKLVKSLKDMFLQIHGGEATTSIIS
ncbi:B3/B4 domain-containing protein [Litchfieldia alkalitelluris]|uniref:B3/B4 domain-containing protein n=1 Tax=Litchfieldia alkalitelluris TaxID=304268 RepID=UPI0009968EDE|nr:phenylalanine--tRNA ligase beta subunit-related protein [Litchfieldia alkalitelluris]